MRRCCLAFLSALALLAAIPAPAAAAGGPPSQQRAQAALQRVQDLFQGVGVRTGRELTPALAELYRTRSGLDSRGRRTADSLLARPTSTESAPGHSYTVAEATPFCTTHFCIHYVTTTVDAPAQTDSNANGVPDYVELMAQVFENEVFPCENGSAAFGCSFAGTTGLAWPQAPNDGTLGGDSRFDVYIEDLFPSGVFGYVSIDPQPAGSSLHSYLVMDKDFSRYSQTLTGPDEMRVTAAHEYNHVLQFGIDANEDTWMFESTATFFENEVYPAIDDYLSYMPTWVSSTAAPITDANGGSGLKMYGSAVWNHFIAGRHGAQTILAAWEAKAQVNGGSFAPQSYSNAIAANGGSSFSDEFDDFSAAVAEWRVPGAGFPDTYPDVPATARPTMNVGAAATSITLDHTTFAFRNIPVPASPNTTLTLNATLPSGLKGAVALVGRTGASTTSGTVTAQIQRLSNGGPATVTLANAGGYGRITAVLVNSDPTQNGWNNGQNDWNFTKDNESFTGVQATAGVPAGAPVPTTTAASSVATTSATLNGTVDPSGQPTTYWFDYGTTTAYGSQVPAAPASAGGGNGATAFSASAGSLTRGTTYHYRIVASNSSGTVAGADRTFRTLDPPVVTTGAAGAVGSTSAILTGTVDPRGRATTYTFEYGPTSAYGAQVSGDAGNGTGAVSEAAQVGALDPATAYHFRLVATSADGTTAGADATFTTAAAGAGPTTTSGPTGTSGAGPTTVKLALTAQVLRATLRAALAKGLRLRAGCGESCALRVKLMLPAKLAKRLRLTATLATAKASPGAAGTTLTLRVGRRAARALARLKKLALTAKITATAPDGRTAAISRAVTLRR